MKIIIPRLEVIPPESFRWCHPQEENPVIKATLYVPAIWSRNRHYARLWDGCFRADIGQNILRGLAQSSKLYQELPLQLSITVEWVESRTDPESCGPRLVIETDGVQHHRIHLDQDQVTGELGIALSQSELAQLIPECRIQFGIYFVSHCRLTTT